MTTPRVKLSGGENDSSNRLEVVRQQVASLRYGVVEIIVQDSRVVQIETTERTRFEKSGGKAPGR